MLKNINLKDLKLVQLISESGSLTSAARQMHVSQPAASQRLAQLQSRVGQELFLRKDGVMQPTQLSDRITSAANVIDKELETCWLDIQHILSPANTQLRVATQCYTSYRWLPFVLREMHQEFPDIDIDVLPEATENPYQALLEERIDVALVFNRDPAYDMNETPLFEDELYAVMHKNHPLASRHYLNPQNFENETLVLYTGDKHAIIEEQLKPAGAKPHRLMQVRMTEAIVELVRAGHGIAVLSGWAFDDIESKSELRAVRISQGGFIRQWQAISLPASNSENSEHLKRFVHILKKLGPLLHNQKWRKAISKKGSLSS